MILNRLRNRLVSVSRACVSTVSRLGADETKLVDGLFDGIVSSKRADLARCITLVETSNANKKIMAQYLLNKILARLKENREAGSKVCLRLG